MSRDWQALILPGSRQGREGDNSMRSVWEFLTYLKDERKLKQAGRL